MRWRHPSTGQQVRQTVAELPPRLGCPIRRVADPPLELRERLLDGSSGPASRPASSECSPLASRTPFARRSRRSDQASRLDRLSITATLHGRRAEARRYLRRPRNTRPLILPSSRSEATNLRAGITPKRIVVRQRASVTDSTSGVPWRAASVRPRHVALQPCLLCSAVFSQLPSRRGTRTSPNRPRRYLLRRRRAAGLYVLAATPRGPPSRPADSLKRGGRILRNFSGSRSSCGHHECVRPRGTYGAVLSISRNF